MQFRQALLAATVLSLAVCGAAQAQVSGIYIGVAAGLNSASNTSTKNHPVGRYSTDQNQGQDSNTFGTGFQGTYSMGPVGLVNMGYGFGNGFRAELEGFMRSNGISNITMYTGKVGQGGLTTNSGTLRTFGAMANFYYDIDPNFFPESARFFQPYVGLGIGFAQGMFQNAIPREPNRNGNQQQTNYLEAEIGKGGGNLAYQAIIGAAFAIDSVAAGLAVTTELRHYAMLGAPMNARAVQVTSNNGQVPERRTASSDSFRPSFSGNTLLVGLRYSLDAADVADRPAPNLPVGWSAPPAQPVAVRSYMVFFANNSASLDAAARQVVAEAVQSARIYQSTSIQLLGHADRTGRNPHNDDLARDRMRNVTTELNRLGVPRDRISGSATGAAGSAGADPQSRRVDILLR